MKSRISELKNFGFAAITVLTATIFVACSSDDDSISENQQPANGKYTMTIKATKGSDATTRALTLTGSTLTPSWATTEHVYVKKGSSWATGSLVPDANAATATLKGELSGITINTDDVLTLQFPKSGTISYSGQVGTLADIAANYDYATASVTVTDVSGGNITADDVTFTNQQAIAKFTLVDKANNAALNATHLSVSVGLSDTKMDALSGLLTAEQLSALQAMFPTYELNPTAATYSANGGTGILFLAIPDASAKLAAINAALSTSLTTSDLKFVLTATVGSDTYTLTKNGFPFVNGQYYEITAKMTQAACSYTAPTLVSGTLTYNGSAQALVTGGSATNATIYYSTDGSSWNTSVPTGTNAGNYTVYYKVEPADGYTGGVASTSLGTKTINKANGWCSLSSTSSSDWSDYWENSVSVNVNHHGGSLSTSKSGNGAGNLSVSISGNTMTLSKGRGVSSGVYNVTVTVTCAATQNYNAASATYTCYE